jgi:hypothetical protein
MSYLIASVGMKIPFISLLWSWVEGLLVSGCWLLSTSNRVFHSKIYVSKPFYPSLTVPWIEFDSEINYGWL